MKILLAVDGSDISTRAVKHVVALAKALASPPTVVLANVDAPLLQRVAVTMGAQGVARGDLGPSLKYKDKTVLQNLKENYAVSLILGLSAILIAGVVGVTLGVLAALRQNRPTDYGVMAVAILGGLDSIIGVVVEHRTKEPAA